MAPRFSPDKAFPGKNAQKIATISSPNHVLNSQNLNFPSECWCWWLVVMNVVGKAFPTWRCSWNLMGRICVILKLLLSRPLPLETLHQLVLYRLERPQHLVAVLPSPHPPLSLHINMAVNAGQQVVPPCLCNTNSFKPDSCTLLCFQRSGAVCKRRNSDHLSIGAALLLVLGGAWAPGTLWPPSKSCPVTQDYSAETRNPVAAPPQCTRQRRITPSSQESATC